MKTLLATKRKISDYFSQRPEILAVYLFGSQFKNSAGKDSDIDLGLLVGKETSFGGFDAPETRYTADLQKILKIQVDIIDLTSAPVDFAFRVISEGEILSGINSRERIEFEERLLRVYQDMKPFFDEYAKSIHEIARKGEINVRYL